MTVERNKDADIRRFHCEKCGCNREFKQGAGTLYLPITDDSPPTVAYGYGAWLMLCDVCSNGIETFAQAKINKDAKSEAVKQMLKDAAAVIDGEFEGVICE